MSLEWHWSILVKWTMTLEETTENSFVTDDKIADHRVIGWFI